MVCVSVSCRTTSSGRSIPKATAENHSLLAKYSDVLVYSISGDHSLQHGTKKPDVHVCAPEELGVRLAKVYPYNAKTRIFRIRGLQAWYLLVQARSGLES